MVSIWGVKHTFDNSSLQSADFWCVCVCVCGAAVHLDLAQWQLYRPTAKVVNTVKTCKRQPPRAA